MYISPYNIFSSVCTTILGHCPTRALIIAVDCVPLVTSLLTHMARMVHCKPSHIQNDIQVNASRKVGNKWLTVSGYCNISRIKVCRKNRFVQATVTPVTQLQNKEQQQQPQHVVNTNTQTMSRSLVWDMKAVAAATVPATV